MNNLLKDYTKESIEKLFKEAGTRNPIIEINGVTYTVGRGINDCNLADIISKEEIKRGINKICFNPSLEYYYVLTPDYYNNLGNIKHFDWIGEMKSKLSSKPEEIRFGFGRNKSGLIKYNF